jgi:hypothetical protein
VKIRTGPLGYCRGVRLAACRSWTNRLIPGRIGEKCTMLNCTFLFNKDIEAFFLTIGS